MPRRSHDPEELLALASNLSSLARELVTDPNAADDLVQETWLRVLSRSHEEVRSPRRFFSAVLRNLAAQDRRAAARRRRREQAAARSEASDAGARSHERLALHRSLVEAIEALDEPYRDALVLRYFDGLPPREIASRLGVPVKTVKTRLSRGLALLRGRLDARYGERRAWVTAFLPLTGPAAEGTLVSSGTLVTAVTTAAAVSTTTQLAAVAAVAATALGLYLLLPDRSTRPSSPASGPLTAAAEAVRPVEVPPPSTGEERAVVAEGSTRAEVAGSKTAEAPRPRVEFHLYGQVLDAHAVGLGGVRVGFRTGSAEMHEDVEGATETISAGGGAFDLRFLVPAGLAGRSGEILCLDERYETVLGGQVGGTSNTETLEEEHVVVAAPKVSLAGMVVDPRDRPVAGAAVRFQLPWDLRNRFPRALDRSARRGHDTLTDDEGRFALEDVPGLEGATLVARRTGVGRGTIVAPAHSDGGLRIVLAPPETEEGANVVTGVVFDELGAPAADAVVALDAEVTRSEVDGAFEIPIAADRGRPRRLVAVKKGHLPAYHEPDHDAGGGEIWPEYVELRLGGRPRAVSGTVFGIDGEPLARGEVWTDDPTFLGESQRDYLTLEKVMRGDDARWSHVTADEEGRFELGGLADRVYRLRAMDPKRLLEAQPLAVHAGERGLELHLSAEDLWEEVGGRVVDRRGRSVAGVGVQLSKYVQVVESPHGGGVWRTGYANPIATDTDEEGRFLFEDLPRSGAMLVVHGDGILRQEVHLDERIGDPTALEIEVVLRCHVRLEIVDAGRGVDGFGFLGEDGRPVLFQIIAGQSVTSRRTGRFADGTSPVVTVTDGTTTLVLYDDRGLEIERVSIAPVPGKLTTLGV